MMRFLFDGAGTGGGADVPGAGTVAGEGDPNPEWAGESGRGGAGMVSGASGPKREQEESRAANDRKLVITRASKERSVR